MNRRSFLRFFGKSALGSPLLIGDAMRKAGKEQTSPLPELSPGDVLPASYINNIVKRVNSLEESR